MPVDLDMHRSTKVDAASLYRMSLDEVTVRLDSMFLLESSAAYCPVDYLDHSRLSLSSAEDHRESRAKMCQWCYQLTDLCKLSRHAVTRSMGYLDRFIASHHERAQRCLVDRREYQLAAMTALYIAVKLHEPLAMDASLVAEISQGCYVTSEIVDMERDMLGALRWRTSGPTPQEFACLLLGMLNPGGFAYDLEVMASMMEVSIHQCELAAGRYELSASCRPSEVALGSVLNSLEGVGDDSLSAKERHEFLRRMCNLMGSVDISRVKYAKAKLRLLFCANSCIDMFKEVPQCCGTKLSVTMEPSKATSVCKVNCISPLTMPRYQHRCYEESSFAKCA